MVYIVVYKKFLYKAFNRKEDAEKCVEYLRDELWHQHCCTCYGCSYDDDIHRNCNKDNWYIISHDYDIKGETELIFLIYKIDQYCNDHEVKNICGSYKAAKRWLENNDRELYFMKCCSYSYRFARNDRHDDCKKWVTYRGLTNHL